MHKTLHLLGVWIARVLAGFLVLAIALVVLGVVASQRKNISFDRLASMSYEKAIAEVRKNSHGSAYNPQLDNKRVWAFCVGVAAGQGSGDHPRFVNIGRTPMTIYRSGANDWYILGKAQAYDYVGGQWKANCIVENQKFQYHPLR